MICYEQVESPLLSVIIAVLIFILLNDFYNELVECPEVELFIMSLMILKSIAIFLNLFNKHLLVKVNISLFTKT